MVEVPERIVLQAQLRLTIGKLQTMIDRLQLRLPPGFIGDDDG